MLDWLFRRGAAVHANDYYAANKQFIAWLPIRADASRELDTLGVHLHQLASRVSRERGDFLHWIASALGTRVSSLPSSRALEHYDRLTGDDLLARLARGHARLTVDPRERAVRELIAREHRASVERVVPLVRDLEAAERRADELVYELYELPSAMRELVEAEYE